MNLNTLSSVYIHIPFCSNICNYCDFCKIYYHKKYISLYLDNLEKEIKSRYRGEKIDTIYIGGGTPSSLDTLELKRLFEIIKIFNFNDEIEFTIEANIENITLEKAKLFIKNKVNRISLGVQSFNKDNLKILGRNHTKEEIYEKINLLKEVGFKNINIDLIYGVNSNLDIVKEDIDNFLKLDISHISCYSLILEDNTILKINNFNQIDEDTDYEMYNYIETKLKENNYIHYEISNYAKDGYLSKHNLNYWNNGYYYGFGLSAVSFIDNYRIENTKNLTKYLKGYYIENNDYEDIQTRMETDIILSLRKIEEININNFNQKYNINFYDICNVDKLISEEKILIEKDYLKINPKYLYVMNDIIIELLEGVKI